MNASPPSTNLTRQLRLEIGQPASHAREDFVISASNAPAVAALDAWPAWPGGVLALIGPEGAGKTHLARDWAARVGATVLEREMRDVSSLPGRPVLLEDVDQHVADETLFHLINMADLGATLLLTGRHAPSAWTTQIADLRSRLNALHVANIEPPDDIVLAGIMLKLFRERNIKPLDAVVPYLINRIERSVPAVRDVVRRIDDFADSQKRDVTRAVAKQILADEGKTPDLFE